MSTPQPKPTFAGLSLADDLKEFEIAAEPPRKRLDASALESLSERAGFPSREPKPTKRAPVVRAANFDTRLSLRVTDRDRQRFDDIVYALRVPNGEAFRQLLDLFEETAKRK